MFYIIRKGARKSASAYRFLISMWGIMLVTISLVAFPFKSGLNSVFGKSMLSDILLGGFDPEVIGDLGSSFLPIMSHLVTGSFLLVIAGVIMYSFFAGGLFTRFTTGYGYFDVTDYFKASARYFFPFICIGLIMIVMVGMWTLLTVALPVVIASSGGSGMQQIITLLKIMGFIWLLGMPVLLLVADHSRRWMTTTGTRKVFAALGAGFQSLAKNFFLSYSSVLIILIVNALVSIITLKFVSGTVPEKGVFILLFFIATQILALLKLWIKAWRYATVTEFAAHQE